MFYHRYMDFKMTPDVRRVLELLLSQDEPLTRFKPGGWMIDCEKINAGTANKLVWWSLVQPDDAGWLDEEISYFDPRVNEIKQLLSGELKEPIVITAMREAK